jgi:hypothetical protein
MRSAFGAHRLQDLGRVSTGFVLEKSIPYRLEQWYLIAGLDMKGGCRGQIHRILVCHRFPCPLKKLRKLGLVTLKIPLLFGEKNRCSFGKFWIFHHPLGEVITLTVLSPSLASMTLGT